MALATLTISFKNYSSWSLRGWLLCRMAGLAFEERPIDLGDSDARLHVAFAHLDLWDIHGEDESVSALSLGFDIPL